MNSEPTIYESALGRAVSIWSQGKRIPLPLVRELQEQGYDVALLQKAHLQRGSQPTSSGTLSR